MYIRVLSSGFRKYFREHLAHVEKSGERIVLLRHGQEIGAFVTMQDLRKLEAEEKFDEAFIKARQAEWMRDYRQERERYE